MGSSTEESAPLEGAVPDGSESLGGSLDRYRPAVTAIPQAAALTWAALAVILVFGAFLRLYNVNWDDGHHLHPDERHISDVTSSLRWPGSISRYFDSQTSPLNPYNLRDGQGNRKNCCFVYGTFPIFLGKAVAHYTGDDTYDKINILGRKLTALFDVGTIFLTFLLARRLFGRVPGLLAAVLYAFAPLPIQHAHFFVVDPYMTFWAAFTLFFAVRIAQGGGFGDVALAGLGVGLATASKLTAVSLLPVVLLAAGVRLWPAAAPLVSAATGGPRPPAGRAALDAFNDAAWFTVRAALLTVVVAFLAFRIAQPYAFEAPSFKDILFWDIRLDPRFVRDQESQQTLLSGSGAFPPSIQWVGRSPWVYPLGQMWNWGMGPAFATVGWLGFLYAAWRALFRRQWVLLVPLAWVAGYFGYMGQQFSLYLRYFLPLYPTLAVFAGLILFDVWNAAAALRLPDGLVVRLGQGARDLLAIGSRGAGYALRVGVVATVALTILWGFAYASIYSKPVTRVEASGYMIDNIPQGSVIGQEHWDDALPFSVKGHDSPSGKYVFVTFNNYDADTPDKVKKLLDNLDAVDYIAVSSGRLRINIQRVPAVWPVTSRYYQALDDGSLGFELWKEFTSHPSVLGLHINDDASEEAFTVYDHPRVLIYKKTPEYSRARAVAALHADAYVQGLSLVPDQLSQNELLLRPADLRTQQEGGTWTDIFNPQSFANKHPVIVWLLVLEALALALVPVGLVLFRGLPDRGYLLTKPLGVLILSYLVWLPAALKITHFTRGTIATAFALILAFGLATAWVRRRALVEQVRAHWRAVLLMETLFLAAFLVLLVIRINNPDLWHPARGGEKPMDLTYLIAVTKSTTLPPYDAWCSGCYQNYYYYGQFMTGTLMKFTGIVPEVTYNLAVPMYFALAAAAAFSVGYNLSEGARRIMRRRPGLRAIAPWTTAVAGVLTVLLVLVAGNMGGVQEEVKRLQAVSDTHALSGVPLIGGAVETLGGAKEQLFGDKEPPAYDFWGPSRMIKDEKSPTITEFPYFTFLFADLHAHLMSIPFTLTAIGLALAAVLTFTRAPAADRRARQRASWGLVALLGLSLGAIRWINSWDLPQLLLLAAAALLIAERAVDGRVTAAGVGRGVAKAVIVGLLAVVLFLPFQRNYHQAYAGVTPSKWSTSLHWYAMHFGLFLFTLGVFGIFILYRALLAWKRARDFGLRVGGSRRPEPLPVLVLITGISLLVVLALHAASFKWHGYEPTGRPVVGMALVGLVVLAVLAWREAASRRPDAPVRLFLYALIGLGLGLSAGVDVVTLRGDIDRMNTMFKFYLQIWEVFAIASAFGAWYLFVVVRPQRYLAVLRPFRPTTAAFAGVALGGFVLLLFLAAFYPVFGTHARINDRFRWAEETSNGKTNMVDAGRTLNGMEYMKGASFDDRGPNPLVYDYDAIRWLRENVKGSPPIIEASTPIYHWGSRFSIYTGLPDVVGWQWHQEQQRGRFASMIGQRVRDVNTFYSSPDTLTAKVVLRRYDVQYVIVGPTERAYYPAAGIQKIDQGLDGVLELVYQNAGTRIFRVAHLEPLGLSPVSQAPAG